MVIRDPKILGGSPTIKGTRFSVHNLVSGLNQEDNSLEYLTIHGITLKEAINALNYCIKLKCQKEKKMPFCEHCVLYTLNNRRSIDTEKFIDKGDIIESPNGKFIFLGSQEEFEDDEFGTPGWHFAEIALLKLNELNS